MADWTTIDTNDLLPGEPWTSAKATAVYENVLAQAEGAPDAPRQESASMGLSTAFVPETNTGDCGNTVVIPSTDVGQSRNYMVYFSGYILHDGTIGGDSNISFEGSNDNAAWTDLLLLSTVNGSTSTGQTGLFVFDAPWRYFRVRASGDGDHTWTSGQTGALNARDGYRFTVLSSRANEISA